MEKLLPKNWLSIPFTDIFGINGGTQPHKAVFIDEPKEGYIRLLQIRDFGSKPVPTYIPDTGKLMTCKKDDILIARYGASIGRIVTGMEGSYNVALAKVSIPDNMNKNFVKWLLKSNLFQEPILSIQRTAQNGFNKTDLASIYIPLPTLPEQNRIVTKLDALFDQLETIKKSMANVPLLLKDFRQQVLTQAVTGKLTEEWRKGKKLEIWKKIAFEELVFSSNNGLSKRSGKSGKETTVLRLADFKDAIRKYGTERKIMLTENERKKYSLKNGDLLVIRVNGSVSIAGLFIIYQHDLNEETYCDHFIRYRIYNTIAFPTFITYITNSGYGRDYLKNSLSTSAGQNTINQKSINSLIVNLPPIEEQQEIVSRVENLFAKADAIEKQYESLKTKIYNLPQALLHKAFKGELTEQLESDGDARQLLREIEALRSQSVKSKTKKSSTKKVKPYSEKEEVLGMVAEKRSAYENDKEAVDNILESINHDYEIAVVVLLTRQRMDRTYGKKYIHKMFSNIQFLEDLPVFEDLKFQENHWGMYCPIIDKTIKNQKYICFEEITNERSVLNFNFKYIKEVSDWMKRNDNTDFVLKVEKMLSIYQKPLIDKDMDRIELLNTVLECINVLETYNFDPIWHKMKKWKMQEDGYATKADKFNPEETKLMIEFIKGVYERC